MKKIPFVIGTFFGVFIFLILSNSVFAITCTNPSYPVLCTAGGKSYCMSAGTDCNTAFLCNGLWTWCMTGYTGTCVNNVASCQKTGGGDGGGCPPDLPNFCSAANLCFPNWVDCSTIKYCKNNYYGCHSGEKLICFEGTPYCFDKCIKDDTVAKCGEGLWGCWIESCGSNSGSIPTCYNGQYKCCPSAYPIYKGDYDQCWADSWECTSNDQCGTDNVCVNNKCVVKKTCLTCPPPTSWSDCADGKMQRSFYKCDSTTNYICTPQIQDASCGPQCESDQLEHKLFVQSTSQPYLLKYNCPTEIPEVAFASIKDKLASVWYYDESKDQWEIWIPTGESPGNLNVILCGETYQLSLKEREVTFKCPESSTPHNDCLQVQTLGYNSATGECKYFSTTCLDSGFVAVQSCPGPVPPTINWTLIGIIALITVFGIGTVWLVFFKGKKR